MQSTAFITFHGYNIGGAMPPQTYIGGEGSCLPVPTPLYKAVGNFFGLGVFKFSV